MEKVITYLLNYWKKLSLTYSSNERGQEDISLPSHSFPRRVVLLNYPSKEVSKETPCIRMMNATTDRLIY